MKYCGYCGQVMNDFDSFCNNCGAAAIPTPDAMPDDVALAEEKCFLSDLHRFLKYERLSWKISAIVLSCLLGFYILFSFIYVLVGLGVEEFFFVGFGFMFMFYAAIIFLPLVIIGFVMISKTERYMEFIQNDADVEPAIKRAGSVGMIVFAAFFNEIALIFIIINFVRIKSHPQIVSRILDRRRVN